MLGQGFLGTRADWLMDLVIVSLVVIVPALLYSWAKAREGEYGRHKRWQLWLTGILTVAILAFEADLRMIGGMEGLTQGSRYFGTPLLDVSTYVHLFFAVSTAVIWIALIVASLRRFDSPPLPGAFSRTHKRWGKIGMIWMIMTGLTGLELYIVGLVL
jgi:uncharacterized membrane protein YozB (DUF420 family)